MVNTAKTSSNIFSLFCHLVVFDIFFFVALPNGCDSMMGEHDFTCLLSLWEMVGCLEEGHKSPFNLTTSDLDKLNDMNLK